MAAKNESDIESDEEFDNKLLSISGHSKSNVYYHLGNQFSKNRLDRVEKLLTLMPTFCDIPRTDFLPTCVHEWIDALVTAAFQYMPAKGCLDSLRLILGHFGETISKCQITRLVLLAKFHRDTDSLQFLRDTFGDAFIKKAIEDMENGSCVFSSRLLLLSEHGALVDLSRSLLRPAFDERAVSDKPASDDHECMVKCRDIIEKVAELGRIDLVEALLAELHSEIRNTVQDDSEMFLARLVVLKAACRKGDFPMASSVLTDVCIALDEHSEVKDSFRLIFSLLLNGDTFCPVQFLESILVWMKASVANTSYEIDPQWFGALLRNAIYFHRRPHLEIVLDEIDRIGNVFHDFPWFLMEVLQSKSTSILRIVLLRYPEAFIQDLRSDPVQILCDHHWTVGARLLVEAGAVTKGNVPQEYSELFKLSLEDRCRIEARRNIKRPLVQNVHRLPLPRRVKCRIIYRKPT